MIADSPIGSFAISTESQILSSAVTVLPTSVSVPSATIGTPIITTFDLKIIHLDWVLVGRDTLWRVR